MRNKILIAAFLLMASVSAWAEDSFIIDSLNLKFTVTDAENKCVSVGNSGTKLEGDLIIPSTVENDGKTYTVTTIGDGAFEFCWHLASVTIPNSVKSIGSDAFLCCDDMTSITIPESVISIGDYAFYDCSGLTSVTIPCSVTSIGMAVFKGCSSLQSITFPYVYKEPFGYIFGPFEYEGAIKTAQDQLIEKSLNSWHYCEYCFYIPSTLKSVTINGGKIANSAFCNCNGLSSIIIGDSVTAFGEEAFYGCSRLASVIIGDFEGREDVNGNDSLTTVIIGNGVKHIETGAFYHCNNLTTVIIGDSVTTIGKKAFDDCSSLTSLVIGESVYSVEEEAFYGCDSLTSVIIKSDVSFPYDCGLWIKKDGIEYRVENKNTLAVDCSFWNDYSGDIIIPVTVTAGNTFDVKSISSYTFNRDSITSITIPNSVTEIGGAAFSGCRSLTSITIPNSVVSIGDDAFGLVKNIVYSGNAEGSPWGALTVNGIIDGTFVYSDAEKTHLTAYIGDGGDVVIPDAVTSIGRYAFNECSNITTITIPITVNTIGENAFSGCTATINCMVEKRPNRWDSHWCGDEYKGEIVWKTTTPVTESAANAENIYAYGRNIVVENAAEEIRVYDVMGKLVCRDAPWRVSTGTTTITINGTGVYIVKVGDVVKRVVIN